MNEFQEENDVSTIIKAPSIIVLDENISKEAFEIKWNELLLKNGVLNKEISSSTQVKCKSNTFSSYTFERKCIYLSNLYQPFSIQRFLYFHSVVSKLSRKLQ